jgi:hypothetical protein
VVEEAIIVVGCGGSMSICSCIYIYSSGIYVVVDDGVSIFWSVVRWENEFFIVVIG